MLEVLLKRRIRKLADQVEALLKEDRKEDALRVAEKAYSEATGGLDRTTAEYVIAAVRAGSARYRTGDSKGAQRALEDAAQSAEAALANQPLDYAVLLNDLSVLNWRRGRRAESLPLMEKAVDIKRRFFGRGSAEYADNLQDLVHFLIESDEIGRAEPYLGELAEIAKRHFGEKDPEYASALRAHASVSHQCGKHAEAAELLRRAGLIDGSPAGSAEPDTALANEVKKAYVAGEYATASRLYRQFFANLPELPLPDFVKSAMGNPLDPLREYVNELEKRGQVDEEAGRLEEAAHAYRQILEIFQVSLGDRHPHVALAMNNLGEVLRKKKAFPEAKRLLVDAARRLQGTGKELQTVLANVARLYLDICDERAPYGEERFSESLAGMRDKPADYARSLRFRFPINDPNEGPIANAIRWIDARAKFYQSMGDRATTCFLLETAVEMSREVSPGDLPGAAQKLFDHYLETGDIRSSIAVADVLVEYAVTDRQSVLSVAETLSRHAQALSGAGDHEAGERVLTSAIQMVAKEYGADHLATLPLEENLMIVRHRLGSLAKEDMKRFVDRYRKAGFADSHRLQRLASYQMELGEYEEAETCYRKVIEVQREEIGGWHPEYAVTLSNFGTLQRYRGRFAEAEKLYREAIRIRKTEYGPFHRSVMDSLIRLTITLGALRRWSEAFDCMREAMAISDRWLGHLSGVASEAARINIIREQITHMELAISLLYSSQESRFTGEVFEWLLRRKAIASTAATGLRTAILSGRYPQLRDKLAELDELKTTLAKHILAGGADSEPESWREALHARGRLESELARSIPELKLDQVMSDTTLTAVAGALPPDFVLLEFLTFHAQNFDWTPERGDDDRSPARHGVFVVHAGSSVPVAFVECGDATEIDRDIVEFARRAAHGARALGAAPQASEPAADTGRRIAGTLLWPLLPLLGDRKRILVAPDAQLCRLPFDLLTLPDGRLAIEDYELSYVGAGRDVLRFSQTNLARTSPPLIFADPDFDLALPEKPAAEPFDRLQELRSIVASSFTGSHIRFTPLPNTRLEGERIARLLPGAVLKAGSDAVVSELWKTASPAILHFATHGFFAPPKSENQRVEVGNAMYYSGLALAGANSYLQGRGLPDSNGGGIVTAEEVTTLNLLDTELVVLSACDTGIGSVLSGEGVFGLRRAFFVAGAKTVVMSLWKVPDAPTAELMVAFYTHLKSGKPKSTALRDAKLDLLRSGAPSSAWAAFICEGDWRPLPQS